MPVACVEHQQVGCPEEEVDASIEEHQVNICQRIFQSVSFDRFGAVVMGVAGAVIGQEYLYTDDDEVQRGRDQQ